MKTTNDNTMKTYTIELTEPVIHILAETLGKHIYNEFMGEVINEEGDTMYDRIESEGSLTWYEEQYDNFVDTILDIQKQENIW